MKAVPEIDVSKLSPEEFWAANVATRKPVGTAVRRANLRRATKVLFEFLILLSPLHCDSCVSLFASSSGLREPL